MERRRTTRRPPQEDMLIINTIHEGTRQENREREEGVLEGGWIVMRFISIALVAKVTSRHEYLMHKQENVYENYEDIRVL